MIVAANWKMNPSLDHASVLAKALASQSFPQIKRILFAPHPYLVPMSVRLTDAELEIGGQDCHFADQGAFTGDVSASMLRDCGASLVLLGHSERRAAYEAGFFPRDQSESGPLQLVLRLRQKHQQYTYATLLSMHLANAAVHAQEL